MKVKKRLKALRTAVKASQRELKKAVEVARRVTEDLSRELAAMDKAQARLAQKGRGKTKRKSKTSSRRSMQIAADASSPAKLVTA